MISKNVSVNLTNAPFNSKFMCLFWEQKMHKKSSAKGQEKEHLKKIYKQKEIMFFLFPMKNKTI